MKRIDVLMVERGLASSRTRAQAEIDAGNVWCDGRQVTKPALAVSDRAHIEITGTANPWLSRGGLKLDHALKQFALDLAGRIVVDVGASTGGFTDVALERGAAKVYAIDVGHDQLDERLRGDPRVVMLEGVNARDLSSAHVPEAVGAILCDVSFISLRMVLPAAMALAAPAAVLVALIKPQFEVGRDRLGKGGIVRDANVVAEVCGAVETWLAAAHGWSVVGVIPSPILGGDGNREFFIAARRQRASGE